VRHQNHVITPRTCSYGQISLFASFVPRVKLWEPRCTPKHQPIAKTLYRFHFLPKCNTLTLSRSCSKKVEGSWCTLLYIVWKCFNSLLMLTSTLSYSKFEIIQLRREDSAAKSNVERCFFCVSAEGFDISGAIRLDGSRSKKQVWRPHFRTWSLPEANVLYWKKCLWHCWDFSAPP